MGMQTKTTGQQTGAAAPGALTTGPALAAGISHHANHGDNRVHYVTLGHGQHTIVFVHGWACHLGFWREQIAALADQARLILIDLPGHGRSDQPETDYTMDYLAGAVLAVLLDAKVEQATFIGHSMGQAVVCRVGKLAPEKVTALVSVDGLLRRPQGVPGQAEALIAQFQSPHYREVARGFVRSFFPVPGTEALRESVTAEVLLTPQHVMASAMKDLLDTSRPDWDLQRVPVPVLVLNAKGSLWTADYENYVRSLSPRTEYRQFENVGHWLMLEQPAAFNAALTAMLRKHDLLGA